MEFPHPVYETTWRNFQHQVGDGWWPDKFIVGMFWLLVAGLGEEHDATREAFRLLTQHRPQVTQEVLAKIRETYPESVRRRLGYI